MAAHGYCEGCFRTLDEIAGWATRSEDDKRAIWQALPQRAAAAAGLPEASDRGSGI